VVAEGVERKEEVGALVDLGVDWLQGFYFAHPDYPLPLPRF
jgi:EAL domain-containing protein (putative c-di-GMP-specific phosphodiesterase class I)